MYDEQKKINNFACLCGFLRIFYMANISATFIANLKIDFKNLLQVNWRERKKKKGRKSKEKGESMTLYP